MVASALLSLCASVSLTRWVVDRHLSIEMTIGILVVPNASIIYHYQSCLSFSYTWVRISYLTPPLQPDSPLISPSSLVLTPASLSHP